MATDDDARIATAAAAAALVLADAKIAADDLFARNERAQAKVHRWGRMELVVVICTAVIVVAALILGLFILPIRDTVREDRCIVRATAVSVAKYQTAVAAAQEIPIGPQRAATAAAIVKATKTLTTAVETCHG